MPVTTTVALPVYNEAANLASLLDFLLREAAVKNVIVVDDRSDDDSYRIAREYATRDPRVIAIQNHERSGQLAGWLNAARVAETPSVVFVDADSRPERDAVGLLAETIESDREIVAASGRVVPDAQSARWAAARFRAAIQHRVRALQFPKETIIGRFFGARRDWFLHSITRSDIIANDAYLGGLARRQAKVTRYVPTAICRYVEAQNTFDFAAQRQRADAGYRQLRELGILVPQDEPKLGDYLRCFATSAALDPIGAGTWALQQMKARRLEAYRQSGRDAGAWEIQTTTKRRVD